VLVAALYFCIALVQTAPLSAHLSTHVPLGTYPAATTARLNLWTIWWNRDRLAHGFAGYWQAPIFHPDPSAFAYTETQSLTGLVGSFFWTVSGSPITAYNLLLLLAFTLNGWSGYYLLRRLHTRILPALCGGIVLEMMPIAADQLGVLQSTVLFPVPLVLAAFLQFGRTGRLRHAIAAAVWMAVCFHTSSNSALLLAPVAMLGLFMLSVENLIRLKPLINLSLAASLFVGLVAPVVVPQRDVLIAHEHHRPELMIRATSARVEAYSKMPPTNLVRRRPMDRTGYSLYPGTCVLIMAMAGMWYGLRRRRFRRWSSFLILATLGCFLLSFGPTLDNLPLGSMLTKPYMFLRDYLPGFRYARNLWRFGGLAQILLALLAGFGLAACFNGRRKKIGRRIVGGLEIAVLVGELLAAPVPLIDPGTNTQRLPWVQWLQKSSPATKIVHLPMPFGGTPEEFEETTYWMVCQMDHGRAMANGYAGYAPDHTAMLTELMSSFPDSRSIEALRRLGITHVLATTEWLTPQRAAAIEQWNAEVVTELATPEMTIFRLAAARG
jgi:hypothetical protein